MIISARATGVRMSPRKVGEVASLIRGRSVADALVILEHTPRRAALPLVKLVKSAAANAENNHKMTRDSLSIEQISVGNGFSMKRFRPAAHGRALPYKKQTSNVSIEISGEAVKPKAAKAKTTTKKAEPKSTKEETK